MNEQEYFEILNSLSLGKRLPTALYAHKSLLTELPENIARLVTTIATAVQLPDAQWEVVKLHTDDFKLSYLSYPRFDSEAYPELVASRVVDLRRKTIRDIRFDSDPNPPILHRKELLVPSTYPIRNDFMAITAEGEQAGLYEDSRRIGFKRDWAKTIQDHGYELVDGRLFRSSTFARPPTDTPIFRERTALSRTRLSSPMRTLSNFGLLEGQHTVCDYGCGRGDDLEILQGLGVDAIGWDPNFYPEGDRLPSDIVNLGYVINVIEDRLERNEALIQAATLARKLLVVSAMVAGDAHIAKFTPYKDGVITSRRTFQKYFSQSELQAYIETTLGLRALAVSSGIFFVFLDEEFESDFTFRPRNRPKLPRASAPRRPTRSEKIRELVAANQPIFDQYWFQALELGRWPTAQEFSNVNLIAEPFGTLRKAQAALLGVYDAQELHDAESRRREELTLSQAMSFFRGRVPFGELSERVRTDVRQFFGTYQSLQSDARGMLASLTETSELSAACDAYFSRTQHGHLENGKAFTISIQRTPELPVILRAYIGCAEQLLGSASNYHLVKIHIHTGKLTFTRYENFDEAPIPFLIERVKIDLWNQRIHYFDYVDQFEPTPLYWKSKFLTADDPNAKKQSSFDTRLDELGLAPENPNFGFSMDQLQEILKHKGLEIRGSRFYKRAAKESR